ncbi:MAG: hypothetical protein SCI25_00250 [Desulfuromonadales bacterium]|nr:hypothetical protein [Desulfuromonadales bacterium]
MRKEKRVTLGEEEIVVSELTVEQVTNVMDGLEAQQTGTLDLLFHDRLPVAAVSLASALSSKKLNGMAPSELDTLWKAVEDVNPFFVGMVERLAAFGQAALAAGNLSAEVLKKPAAS